MKEEYQKLFEPYDLPSGVTLRNRVVVAPMTTHSGFENGMVTNDELAYYTTRSGGVGAFITACAYVSEGGKTFEGENGITDDKFIPGLKAMADTIKGKGAKAILQIMHGGRMVSPRVIGGKQPVSASEVAALRPNAAVPRALKNEEIEQIISDFGDATRRAIEAGFDGVEIHGANTYLLQQFFSPHSNRRTDKWGGSLEKRMALPAAVLESVLKTVAEHTQEPFAVGYRVSPEEVEEPGITISDTLQLLDKLMSYRLDYIHISTGKYFVTSLREKGDKTQVLDTISKHVAGRVPLIGVGSVHTPEDALKVMDKGIPLVAIGRMLLCEPNWVEKIAAGCELELRYRISADDMDKLKIPRAMAENIQSVPGWLPFE